MVGNETILGRRDSGGGGKEWKGREPEGRRKGRRKGRRGKMYISGKKGDRRS